MNFFVADAKNKSRVFAKHFIEFYVNKKYNNNNNNNNNNLKRI